MKNKIIINDCKEVLKKLPKETADLIITDPPYKLSQGGCSQRFVFKSATKEQIKSGILFEIPKFEEWMPLCFDVLKDGTHFYCMTNHKNMKEILNKGEEAGFKILNILVWEKGMHTPLQYYMKDIEFIVLFRKGRARKINNKGSRALIKIPGIYGNKVHPAEKPVDLFKHFVLNSSSKGDLVLDPFAGVCPLAIACKDTERNFICIEKNENLYETSIKRLNNKITQKKFL